MLFSLVGIAGFFVDSGVLYVSCVLLEINPILGRLLSYFAAATTTWQLNRKLTFPFANADRPHRQWTKFIATNAVGGVVNYGVFVAIIINSSHTTAYLIFAVAAGSLSGLGFNFLISKYYVFSHEPGYKKK
ncbi:MAG: GtrA family protein [Thiotrichales bacterium]